MPLARFWLWTDPWSSSTIETSWYQMLGGEHLRPKEGRMSAEFIGRIPQALESGRTCGQGCLEYESYEED
jgi:hypothetical protein